MSVARPQWLIQVPQDLKYFPVPASLLFETGKLGGLNEKIQKEYRSGQGVFVPPDIAGFEMYFDAHEYRNDFYNAMIRLGFAAQVINHLITHGIERYVTEPENAGHGYAVAVINSKELCSDIWLEAHGTAKLIDTENRAKYDGNPLIRVNVSGKGFLARESTIYKFNADKEGRGKEGIFLRR